ncbi:hypothetical protein HER32_17125 [Hymenobacter sp. BT18]|uniref:hypothetical protein n=1 Tax=Hymenobacter sp. BT18 TaxID=2835648 RepID=UPI00143E3A2C|nr:hypothetical protein [Hymenobacter sp. BT18]QIX62801.1 hypothetical protein HER32_17125 [Hymenobacter sp. BT18]
MEIRIYNAQEQTTTTLAVEPVADRVYRAVENDIVDDRLTYGTTFGTVLHESGAHEVVSIIEPSAYTTWRFVLSPRYKESEYRLLGDEITRQGGFWQVDFNCFATINLPPHSTPPLVELFELFDLEPPEMVE